MPAHRFGTGICRAVLAVVVVAAGTVTVAGSAQADLLINGEAWTAEPYYGSRGMSFADVDGDRRADAIVVNTDGITVRRSTGSSFGEYERWTSDPYYGDRGTYFADVTGDGRADAIVVNRNRIVVRASTGSGFGGHLLFTDDPYYGDHGTFFADVTGDGRADAIVVNRDRIVVRASDGGRFGRHLLFTDDPFYGSRGTFFADVDGDRRADALVSNNDRITVRRSDGARFGAHQWFTDEPYFGSWGTQFADATGDGRADAIALNPEGVTVRRSLGARFDGNETWVAGGFAGLHGTYFADADGDRRADGIAVNHTGVLVRRSRMSVGNVPIGHYDAIQRVTGGVRVTGWALDPDTRAPITVQLSVAGRLLPPQLADKPRPDIAEVHLGWGAAHGFDITVPAAVGARVCARAINVGGAATHHSLGCKAPGELNVMNLNVAGRYADKFTTVWSERARRLADQLRAAGNVPDVIALQEVHGWIYISIGGCGIGVSGVGVRAYGDYDQIDQLLWELRRALGITYRVAYLTGSTGYTGDTSQCHIYGAQAVLYRADRLRNETAAVRVTEGHEAGVRSTHLRRSLPLCDRQSKLMPLKDLIDGAPQHDKCGATPSGPAWAAFPAGNGHIIGTAVDFSFTDDPRRDKIRIFNLHPNDEQGMIERPRLQAFVREVTARTGSTLYYPPIIASDPNDLPIGDPQVFQPPFARVLPGELSPGEPVMTFFGTGTGWRNRYDIGLVHLATVPRLPAEVGCPGPRATLISDHCGLFTRFGQTGPARF